MRFLATPFLEVKFDSGARGRFRGYGSTFGNVDRGGDVCAPGCFADTIAEHKAAGTMPDMYWMHDSKEPVGDWIDWSEDAKGLVVEGQIWTGDRETECSRKAYNVACGTGLKGLSIGYKTKAASRDQKSGARRLEAVAVSELSIVGAQAMNPRATVQSIKSIFADGQVPSIRELEDMLRDAGMSATMAKALLAGGYKSMPRDEDTARTTGQEIAELLRIRRALRGEDE